MKRENISEIRRSLEPSAEMKRRVMERAAKLEAGRKTFGNERTTADNRQIIIDKTDKTKEKKESITMSINKSEMNTVKSRIPAAVLSAAACAAIVIGIAAAGLRGSDSKLITRNSAGSAPESQPAPVTTTTSEPVAVIEDDPVPEDVMTVTDKYGSTFTITDRDRIAAIDALIEKAKTCHVWEGEEVPASQTIVYTLDGKQHTVELSSEQLSPYHPDSDPHPEICLVVTVDGKSYAVCEYTPDEPYADLYYATEKGGVLSFQKWDKKSSEINEDEFSDNFHYDEYHNEADARKLKGIIDKVRENGTPQYEAEDLYTRVNENLPSWDDVRASCHITLDGNSYSVNLFWDSDLICIDVLEWQDGRDLTLLYKDTGNWITEFDEAFGSLTDNPEEYDYPQEEEEEVSETEKREPSENDVKVPEIIDMTEEQVTAALKEAGLNCLIEYNFCGVEKGYVASYECTNPDVFSIGEDIYAPKGSDVVVEISLGNYNGAYGMIKPEGAVAYYPTKESKLKVPMPDGLSGPYSLRIYSGGYIEYINYEDEMKGKKSITLDVEASDKQRYVVYAIRDNTEEENLIRYATYEFDYAAEKWTLIGELNTEELLATMK